MKELFNTVTLFFLLSSCSAPYYQLIEIKSDVIKEDGSTAVASNNDLDIILDFWSNGGSTSYKVFNKTKKTIYIKHDECQLIINGLAQDQYDNSEYTSTRGIIKSISKSRGTSKGASISQSNIYGRNSIYTPIGAAATILSATVNASVSNTVSSKTSISNSSSVSSTEKKVYVLLPNSSRIIDGFRLQSYRFWDCNVDEDPSAKNSHIGNGLSYTKENTPLDFRISITYAFSEDFSDKLTYDVTGYVSQFSNWKETVFITEEKYKECEDDNFSKYRNIAPWHSPLRYYKIFYKK